jgi:hypothetical protein
MKFIGSKVSLGNRGEFHVIRARSFDLSPGHDYPKGMTTFAVVSESAPDEYLEIIQSSIPRHAYNLCMASARYKATHPARY